MVFISNVNVNGQSETSVTSIDLSTMKEDKGDESPTARLTPKRYRQLRLTLEIQRRKICGKNLEWHAGIVADFTLQHNACQCLSKSCDAVDLLGLQINDPVDMLVLKAELSKTTNVLKDEPGVEQKLDIFEGFTLPSLVDVTVERREEDLNKRGAKVLHAIKFHGSTAIETELDALSNHHCDNDENKESRNKIFASWILQHFNVKDLNGGILDIAGGRGSLAAELVQQSDFAVTCTVVEPIARATTKAIDIDMKKAFSRISFIQESFDSSFVECNRNLCEESSILIGMHPDQPTEAIVDAAFLLQKPFAIVPCCVYPSLFPDRRLSTGQGVITYPGFIKYLMEKDSRIKVSRLPFQGRNIVLYWVPDC